MRAFATLVGSLLVLELRVFGAQPALSLTALGRLAVRTAACRFRTRGAERVAALCLGRSEIAANPAFRVKLVLILMAGGNALVFHARDSLRRHDGVARLQAGLSLALWFGVIAAGRLIAYV